TQAGNTDVVVKTFAGADHFLQQTKTGSPREMQAADRVKAFAPGYLSTVTDWLSGQLVSPVALAEKACQQIQDGDWQAAAHSYAAILRLNPYRADHWHNYAYVQYKQGRYGESIRAWKKAAELGFAWDPLWERGLVWEKAWVIG